MPECIHGLDAGLCGTCFPRSAPEPPRRSSVVRPPVRPPARPSAVPGATRAPRTRRPAAEPRPQARVTAATHRIFHITHIRNLDAILDTGGLIAGVPPIVDLSSTVTRELRRTAETSPGVTVAAHVPFFVSPNAEQWDELRRGAAGMHWSPAARSADAADLVVLVATFGAVADTAVVADADAAGTLTRFSASPADAERMLRLLIAKQERLNIAEVLVPERVPLDAFSLIGVANDRVRDRVRQQLVGREFTPKVVVYPPWFQPPA